MPQRIAKKLREMKDPNCKNDRETQKAKLDQFRTTLHPQKKYPNGHMKVPIKFASLGSETQKKLLSLMRNIFEIGKAASKIYEGGEDPLIKSYFCAISDPTDLIQTLSRFQTVLYLPDELPVHDNLFWPGEGTMLSETRFTPTGTTVHCLHHDMHMISNAWRELSIRVQISLSTWSDDSVHIEQDDMDISSDYWPGEASYGREIKALISKVDHLICSMPEIASHMNTFAEAQRELLIQREEFENNDYDESEDFRYP